MATETVVGGSDAKTEAPATTSAKEEVKADASKAETVLTPAIGEKKVGDTATASANGGAETPVKYEFKAPEGYQADLTQLEAFAKEHKLSPAAAQKMLEREAGLSKSSHEAAMANHEKITREWMDQVKADKEIGGDKFDASVEAARRVIVKYGDDDLKKALNDSGYGNFPPLVRLFAKIGKLMNEGQIITGAPPSNKPKAPTSLSDVFAAEAAARK